MIKKNELDKIETDEMYSILSVLKFEIKENINSG